jgi:hypothetical protein
MFMKTQITFKYACIYAGTFLSGVCFAIGSCRNEPMTILIAILLLTLGGSASLLNDE